MSDYSRMGDADSLQAAQAKCCNFGLCVRGRNCLSTFGNGTCTCLRYIGNGLHAIRSALGGWAIIVGRWFFAWKWVLGAFLLQSICLIQSILVLDNVKTSGLHQLVGAGQIVIDLAAFFGNLYVLYHHRSERLLASISSRPGLTSSELTACTSWKIFFCIYSVRFALLVTAWVLNVNFGNEPEVVKHVVYGILWSVNSSIYQSILAMHLYLIRMRTVEYTTALQADIENKSAIVIHPRGESGEVKAAVGNDLHSDIQGNAAIGDHARVDFVRHESFTRGSTKPEANGNTIRIVVDSIAAPSSPRVQALRIFEYQLLQYHDEFSAWLIIPVIKMIVVMFSVCVYFASCQKAEWQALRDLIPVLGDVAVSLITIGIVIMSFKVTSQISRLYELVRLSGTQLNQFDIAFLTRGHGGFHVCGISINGALLISVAPPLYFALVFVWKLVAGSSNSA